LNTCPDGLGSLARDHDRLGAVVDVRERQEVVAPEEQEDAREREPDARRERRAARPVDDAGPEHHEGQPVSLGVLVEEPLLAQLGLRVVVALLGVGLERGRLAHHVPAPQLGDPVHAERRHEHDLRLAPLGDDGLEQVLRGDAGREEDVGGRARERRGQVVDELDALHDLGRLGDGADAADHHLGARLAGRAGVAREHRVEPAAVAAAAHEQAQVAVAVREQALDQRRAEEAVRAGDERLQRVTHFHSWVRRGAARSKSRHR
jgi:hypothetical protein